MNSRRGSRTERRTSLAESYRQGSLNEALKSAGSALEAVRLDHAYKDSTFDNESELEEYYKPITAYEGFHRYDPKYTWSEAEEKRIVRKIDWKICTWACFMFFALQLDRGNISQALSDDMLKDLKMNTNEYNTGMTIFYVSFLVAEIPSQLVSKKLGPDRWIPFQMVSWSLIASLQAFLKGRTSFYVCRCLLGLIEGGFIPDTILYLSYYYKSAELPVRLSYFWVSYQSTQIVSSFLAYGILRLRGHNNMEGWRWLFALEGLLTGLIGIVTWFYLPPSPTQTKSRFRGKDGWFTEHEEKVMVNRVLRDDPSKGDMHNRQGLSFKAFWECLTDWHMWPVYLLGLSWLIPNHPIQSYLTLQLKAMGFDTFKTNLLTIPAYALFILQLLFWTWVSEKINQRFLIGLISQIWSMPLVIALALIPTNTNHWAKWALSVLLVGHPYAHAIIVAITSRNAGTVRTRTVASAFYNSKHIFYLRLTKALHNTHYAMLHAVIELLPRSSFYLEKDTFPLTDIADFVLVCVQTSSIIAQNIYRDDDKPMYRRGNRVLIGICAYNMVLFIGTKLFYVYVNKSRAKKWDAMSLEERDHYLATTNDKGNKRLDFRFAH